jgi:mono/diheme cytochrome c family protein
VLTVLASACGPRIGDREPAALYARFCARCHGDDGRGDPERVAEQPDLDLTTSRWVRRGRRERVRERIADGHGSMPAFAKKLSSEELEGLVDYVLQLERQP